MAGQEWGNAQSEFGHAPRRTELEFGLRAKTTQAAGPLSGDDDATQA